MTAARLETNQTTGEPANSKQMGPTIKLTETQTPKGGAQMWNLKFYTMPLEEIESMMRSELESYANAGYNSFTFCRATGSIHIRKIDVRNMADVFETDIYGLLQTN